MKSITSAIIALLLWLNVATAEGAENINWIRAGNIAEITGFSQMSPDKLYLALADPAGAIKIVDTRTGDLHLVLEHIPEDFSRRFTGGVRMKMSFNTVNNEFAALVFAGDGSTDAAIYDLDDGAFKRYIDFQHNAGELDANSILFTPDGAALLSLRYQSSFDVFAGEADNTIQVWNAVSGEHLRSIELDQSELYLATISADGKVLAAADRLGHIFVYDMQSNTTRRTIAVNSDLADERVFVDLTLSSDGAIVAGATADFAGVGVWNTLSGVEIQHFDELQHTVNADLSAAGDRLVYSSPAGGVIRSLENGAVLNAVSPSYFFPDEAFFAADATNLILLENTFARADVINIASNQVERSLLTFSEGLWACEFTNDGSYVAAFEGYIDPLLYVLSASDGVVQRVFEPDIVDGQMWFALSPDSRNIAFSSADKGISISDIVSGDQLRLLPGMDDSGIVEGCFAADGQQFAAATASRSVRVWRLDEPGMTLDLEVPDGDVLQLAFTSDGGTLRGVVKNDVANIVEWDLGTTSLTRISDESFSASNDMYQSIAFSSDASVFVTSRHPTQYWQLDDSWTRSFINTTAAGTLNCVAISPDRKFVATGGEDNVVRIWDVNANSEILVLDDYPSRTGIPEVRQLCLAFSPDGKSLLSGSSDATLVQWDVSDIVSSVESKTGHMKSAQLDLQVAPNPFSSVARLNVSAATASTIHFVLYDAVGVKCAEFERHPGQGNDGSFDIALVDKIANGSYFLVAYIDGKVVGSTNIHKL